MNSPMIVEMERRSPAQLEALAEIWTQACGADLAISAAFAAHNLEPQTNVEQAGWLAYEESMPVGVALASRLSGQAAMGALEVGWIDALAVEPAFQRLGLGSALLSNSERWLVDRGCTQVQLGGNPRFFVPGLPNELCSESFFRRRGFETRADSHGIWDVASDLAGYDSPAIEVDGAIRPAQAGQEDALLAFLAREFPGRWHYKAQTFLGSGGRLSDFMLLWTTTGVDGFCQLTFEDSSRPIERCYPYRLPRPWGHLGPIGVSTAVRGQGYGSALLDAGLRRLHDNGVNGCVIDWTEIPDFYAKFGFKPYRAYTQWVKIITP